jgi:hypothetical protein
MFSMSVAQAAATLAATIIGLDIGLYGPDVVNAVMVVVAVSLVVTSVGTSRAAPTIPPPAAARKRLGETILVPAFGGLDGLRDVVRLGTEVSESVGGIVQPLVPTVSTARDELAAARTKQAELTQLVRELGQDTEAVLHIDRSVAAGLHRATVETDASLLLLGWPGPEGVRAWMFGAGYSEIIAATSTPAAIAALHGSQRNRTVLVARPVDLLPGNVLNLQLGLELATALARHDDEPLVVGPVAPAALAAAGLELPDGVEHREGADDLAGWAAANTGPGDLVLFSLGDLSLAPAAIALHESGRSVIGVTSNPESDAETRTNPMSVPVQSTLAT